MKNILEQGAGNIREIRAMKFTWKTVAALVCSILGTIGWCYVGGWLVLTKPVKGLIIAHMTGTLSVGKVIVSAVQGFLYLSLAGAIWCVGYMLSNYFKED